MLMGPQHFVDTVAREHHLIASSLAALTPPDFCLHVDKAKLMSAFSLHTTADIEDVDEISVSGPTSTKEPVSDDGGLVSPNVQGQVFKTVYRPATWPEGSDNVL